MNHNIDHTEKAQKQTVQFMSNGPKIYMLLNREPKQEWTEKNKMMSLLWTPRHLPQFISFAVLCREDWISVIQEYFHQVLPKLRASSIVI